MLVAYSETVSSAQCDWSQAFLGAQEQFFASHSEVPYLPKFRISLSYLKYCGTIFRLNEPVEVSLFFEDDVWNCENEMLGSFSSADTPERAVHAFCEDFLVLWHEIARFPDDSLAPDAIRLKRYLNSLVRSVEKGE